MSFFSFFRKNNPEKVYDEIAENIVGIAIFISSKFDETDPQITANIGAEIVYVLLHITDRTAFQLFDTEKRNDVYDSLYKSAIVKYCNSILQPGISQDTKETVAAGMLEGLNERQNIYAKCKSLFGEPFPSIGTIVFALSYFVYKAMGLVTRNDVDAILSGDKKIELSENDDFPNSEQNMKINLLLSNAISTLDIKNTLNRIK